MAAGSDAGGGLRVEDEGSRFIFSHRDLRPDGTVKPDAFIPHPYSDLSVSKKTGVGEDLLWEVGRKVAALRSRSLVARADAGCRTLLSLKLGFKHDPTEMDPNHWNVIGWPPEKSAQKIIAQQICAAVGKAKIPPAALTR